MTSSILNIKSVPVIYTNNISAWMASNIFAFRFESEVLPPLRHHLHSRTFGETSLLLLDHRTAHPPAAALKSQGGKIRDIFLPKDITTLIQLMDPGIIEHSNSIVAVCFAVL
jgi:hypothetical protein